MTTVDERREYLVRILSQGRSVTQEKMIRALLLAFQRNAEGNALLQAVRDHLTHHEILARSTDLSEDGIRICEEAVK